MWPADDHHAQRPRQPLHPTGHHVASWRHPRAQKDAHVNIKHYVEICRTAERAKFDMAFLADPAATRKADIEAQCRSNKFFANCEPITLLSAISIETERICGATACQLRMDDVDPIAELTPVAVTADQPVMVLGRKDLPANNLQESIAYAKANQDTILHCTGGIGSAPHLAIELLNSTISIKARHVVYRGGGPAMQDLLTSRFDYFGTLPATAMPQLEAKTVKALAILSRERLPALPDVRTAHEQGLKDFEVVAWYAFFQPKGTPEPIVRKLHAATVATIDTPDVRMRLEGLAYTMAKPERRSLDYLQKLMVSETKRWAKVVEDAGIPPQ